MIEPDIAPRPARRRVTTAVVVAALIASLGGLAMAVTAGDGDDAQRAVSARGEVANSPEPAALPSAMSAEDSAGGGARSKMMAPYWSGMEFEVDGDLPELGGTGRAYAFYAPDLSKADVVRMATALGLDGDAVKSAEGGWTVTTAEGRLQVFPTTDGWSVGYQRAGFAASQSGSAKISAADAEQKARALLAQMGVFAGQWHAQAYESTSQGGFDLACEEALKALEQNRVESSTSAASGQTEPARDADVKASDSKSAPEFSTPPACAKRQPEPVSAQSVNFTAIVDGTRTDWNGWSVNVRADKVVDGVYGTIAELRPAETYELRGTKAALEELRDQNRAVPAPGVDTGSGESMPMPMPLATTNEATNDPMPAADLPADSGPAMSGGGSSRSVGSGVATPAIAPDAPVTSIAPDVPACARDARCEPQKVHIASVVRTLTSTTVWTDGTARMHLVPAYRFVGHFGDDEKNVWETTLLAVDSQVTMPPPGLKAVPPVATEPMPTR